jgi:Domain of Unknown Function (DUF1087)
VLHHIVISLQLAAALQQVQQAVCLPQSRLPGIFILDAPPPAARINHPFRCCVQVANFELTEQEAEAAAKADAPETARVPDLPAAGPQLWNALLGDRYQDAEARHHAELGRGRRSRRQVNYAEDGDEPRARTAANAKAAAVPAAGAAASGTAAAAAASAAAQRGAAQRQRKRRGSDDGEWRPEDAGDAWQLPPRLELDGASGALLTVYGLDRAARLQFVEHVMRRGLPLDDEAAWHWGAPCLGAHCVCTCRTTCTHVALWLSGASKLCYDNSKFHRCRQTFYAHRSVRLQVRHSTQLCILCRTASSSIAMLHNQQRTMCIPLQQQLTVLMANADTYVHEAKIFSPPLRLHSDDDLSAYGHLLLRIVYTAPEDSSKPLTLPRTTHQVRCCVCACLRCVSVLHKCCVARTIVTAAAGWQCLHCNAQSAQRGTAVIRSCQVAWHIMPETPDAGILSRVPR